MPSILKITKEWGSPHSLCMYGVFKGSERMTKTEQEIYNMTKPLIEDLGYILKEEDFKDNYAILRKGKKGYWKLENK